MSADAHLSRPTVAIGEFAADEPELQASWHETVIVTTAATIAILFVSFVAVVMALA